ncbi:MAG: hypothetical protein ABI629_12385, partial [bacterium]
IRDLRAGARPLRIQRAALAEEATSRGHEVLGDRLYPQAGAGAGQQGLGAFLGGMGVGSGSIGGTLAGAATGMLTPMNAMLAVAGLLVGKMADVGREAYATEMRYLSMTLGMARATGIPAQVLMGQAVSEADQYKVFELPDVIAARQQLLRGTGHAETTTSILPVAALTGQTAAEETQRIVAMTRLAPRFNPRLSSELLRAYAGSATARSRTPFGDRGVGPDGKLGFDASLYGEFSNQAGRVAQRMATPFTRVPVEGAAAELGAATRLPMPGIDMASTGGLEVATNLVDALNQLTGRNSDAFGDMGMLGVLRMRGTPAAEQLRNRFGIDISTPIGVMRAANRGPQLAAEGFPDVQKAILDTQRQFLPDDDTRAMALTLGRGMDPEAAYQVTRPGVESVIDAPRDAQRGRGPGPQLSDGDIDRAAGAMSNRADVDQFYQWNVRPESMMLQGSLDLGDRLGAVITSGMNDMKDTVRQVLTDFLNSPGPGGGGGESGPAPLAAMSAAPLWGALQPQ